MKVITGSYVVDSACDDYTQARDAIGSKRLIMGVNHGVTGDRGNESPEFGVGTLMQIVPQILSCFKISRTRLLALQYRNAVKKLSTP